MGAARKVHVQRVHEDAGESHEVYTGFDMPAPVVPLWPEMGELSEEFATPLDDAMAHVVDERETWPAWRCDCNQPNAGDRLNCAYCGSARDDI